MNNLFNKIVTLICLWILTTTTFAANNIGEITGLANNLAEIPGIRSTTQGQDALSGKLIKSIPLIKGNIPFSMNYETTLRYSSDTAVDYYQNLQEGAVANWTNEYSNYIMTDGNAGNQGSVYIIQLPGNSEKIYFVYDQGKWKRIYYSIGGFSSAQTFLSDDTRDVKLLTTGPVVTIVKDGVTYIANISTTYNVLTKSDTLMKFTKIIYQDGRQLTLSYDNGINLVQVKDNRNNTLNILREYKKAGATDQSALERKLITGVELISGTNVQRSTINYQESEVQSIVNPAMKETRYVVSSIDSIVGGKIFLNYTNIMRGSLFYYIYREFFDFNTAKQTRSQQQIIDASTYPILNKISDENNNVLQEWGFDNTIRWNDATAGFSIYYTSIFSYSTVDRKQVLKSSSAIDEVTGSFKIAFLVNGQSVIMDLAMDRAGLGNYKAESNLSLMDAATATLTINGTYPAIVSGSTPVRSVTFNPFTHRIVAIKDFNGNTSKFSYDTLNRLKTKTIAVDNVDSQLTTYNYTTLANGAANNFPTPNEIITDSQKVTNAINPNGWITQQVISYPHGGDSKTIGYSYYSDPNSPNYGLISTVDGPRGDVDDNTSITYDNFGNKSTVTQYVNGRSVITKYLNYNTFAQPERIVYPSGLVDQFIYNNDGTLRAKVTGNGGESGGISGATTSYTYDYLKRKKTETNPDNETTSYDYDIIGRLVRSIAPDGSASTQSYFDNGVIQAVEGATLTYNEINADGRISKTRNGSDANYYWKAFSYDGNGNITQTKSALGIIEKWSYDALNRNTSFTDGEGNVSTKTYDKTNNITSSIDAVGSGSSPFNYVNGTLVKDEVNKDYATKSYTYNAADQLTSKSHGSRSCTYSNIDSLGRTGSISCRSDNDSDPAYAYNYQYSFDQSHFGRLDRVTTNTSFGVETSYTYDDLDRVIGKIQTNKSILTWGGSNGSLSVSYGYSAAGKVTSITMPSGRVINYNYEAGKSRLSSIHIAGNPFISNIAYDGLGQLSSWNIEGTGANYTIGYDPSRNGAIKSVRFTNKNGGALYAEEYGFDQDGRIVTLNKLNNYSRIITYDKASRLTDEQNAWYVYDKNGNRIEGPNKYSFYTDKSRNQLHLVYNFDYDVLMTANYLTTGEMIPDSFISSYSGDGAVHYNSSLPGYDGNGQMRYSGGETAQYYMAYNHKNERTVRSSSASGSYYTSAVQFVYDENSNLIGEYTPNGTPIVEYVWMGSRPVAAIYGTGAGKTYAVVTDHNATPRMLIDNATNAAVWQWESTAFGVGKPTGSVKFNLRFPGQYYDELTGLHYNLNRYYIPELGRYMEPDPIGLEGGSNPYVYAGNNPISNVDPSGLFSYENPIFNYADALGLGVNTIGKWFTSGQSSLEPYDFGMNQFQWKELAETNSIEFYYAVKFGMETDTSILADSIKYRDEYNTMKYLEFNDYLQKNLSYSFNNSALKTAELVSTIFTGAGRGSIFDAKDQLSSAQQIGSDVGQAINLTRHLQIYDQPMYINENLYKQIWNQNGFNNKAVRLYSERRR